MVKHHRRAKEEAKIARGVLDALDGPIEILPGKQGEDEREPVQVDWKRADPALILPYPTELDPADSEGAYRRERMDNILLSVFRFGQYSLWTITAQLGVIHSDQLGYAVPTVEGWREDNVDGFADRLEYAHGIFKGRFIMALVDRADKPFVPREHFRDNTPLFGVLNAMIPEHFKRGAEGDDHLTSEKIVEVRKTLIILGSQAIEEQKALAEANL